MIVLQILPWEITSVHHHLGNIVCHCLQPPKSRKSKSLKDPNVRIDILSPIEIVCRLTWPMSRLNVGNQFSRETLNEGNQWLINPDHKAGGYVAGGVG